MKSIVIQNFEDFLNDFQYFKIEGYDAFNQLFEGGSKIVILNTTPYEDGLMLEIQLAIKVDKVEDYIFNFYKQHSDKLSLSFSENISQISSEIPKRNFIQKEIEFLKVQSEIENVFVKKGFSRLDELSELKNLSNHLFYVILESPRKSPNLFKLCQRSYLLRLLMGEKISEADFYAYYEQMQFYQIPEHQLQEFLEFRNFLNKYLLK